MKLETIMFITLLLLCPLMHVFMHKKHKGHESNNDTHDHKDV